ncbi:MAG: hypothetical protein R3277_04190 [Brumimicrobium sp.]|nr:hypothetical protein [Brumimicrobium sp.]
MKLFEIGKYISLIYLMINLLSSLFWPLGDLFFFENYLFLPALIFAVYIFFKSSIIYKKVVVSLLSLFVFYIVLELINKGSINLPHILYLMRWVKYGVLFLIAIYFYQNTSLNKSALIFKGLFLLVGAVNILILVNIQGTGVLLQEYFTTYKPSFLLSNFYEPGVFRLSGSMNNPNDNAVILGVFILFFTMHERFRDFYFAFFAIVLLLLTQSRTAIVSLIIISFIVLLYSFGRHQISKRKLLIFTGLTVLLLAFISLFNLHYLGSIFTGEAFQSNSVMIRVENFFEVVNVSPKTLYIGNGVIDDQLDLYGTYLDSEITLTIAQFGLLGLLAWFIFVVSATLFWSREKVNFKLWVSLFFLYIGTSFTNLSFFSTQLGVIFFVFLALAINIERENKIGSTR